MKKIILTLCTISTLVTFGCQQVETPKSNVTTSPSSQPYTVTAPVATKTTVPTLVYYLYPSITPNLKETPLPSATAPSSRFSPEDLPNDIWIEEYILDGTTKNTGSSSRHLDKGGLYFWPKGGLLDGELFEATEKIISNQAEIHATLNGELLTIIDCGQLTPINSVITAWTYEDHWIIQSVCHGEFDIFWDGVSLNQSKGYQSSFAFQLMGQKPFYLFKKNEKVWLYYDNQEFLLGYEKVFLNYCCEYRAPSHYENMIAFDAIKDGQSYYVLIGIN